MTGTTFSSRGLLSSGHATHTIKFIEWKKGLFMMCGGDIRSCASPAAQGPQAVVIPTGTECHPYTGALLAGMGLRLRGGEDKT